MTKPALLLQFEMSNPNAGLISNSDPCTITSTYGVYVNKTTNEVFAIADEVRSEYMKRFPDMKPMRIVITPIQIYE